MPDIPMLQDPFPNEDDEEIFNKELDEADAKNEEIRLKELIENAT